MNTIGFNSNYATSNVRNNNATPAFKGALGDKFVSKLAKGEVVKPQEVMDAVKGTFGPKSEKVADVVESLLGRVQVLTSNNEANLRGRQIAEEKLKEVPKQIQEAEWKTASEMRESFGKVLKAKDVELAAKDAELKAAKEYAAKYEPMAKVKSIDEIGLVMPEQAIETINEMVSHRAEAAESMFNFLMTGKGQEAALAQIERQNVIHKVYEDGISKIPEVEEALESARRNESIYAGGQPLFFTLDLVKTALHGNSKASYLESPAIKNQVRQNAMGLLSPMCKERSHNMSAGYIEAELDKSFSEVTEFHRNFVKGKAKLEKEYGASNMTETVVPYNNNKSTISIKDTNGSSWDVNFWQVANRGKSNW